MGIQQPYFLITVDAEEDNAWSQSKKYETKNARFLPRFQQIAEKYNFYPTYLTDYCMAQCPTFREFGRDLLKRDAGEIGMHLHAWNTPPYSTLPIDEAQHQPFLTRYPQLVMREKIRLLTNMLEENFQEKVRSHRAGRWAMNESYARALIEEGYRVDCSVTPFVSWTKRPGRPGDYSNFPSCHYFIDLDDIRRPGRSELLEVPVTIMKPFYREIFSFRKNLRPGSVFRRSMDRFLPDVFWLRPDGRNLSRMKKVLSRNLQNGTPYAEFMIHSSELMPEGSPYFKTQSSVDRLFDDIEGLFEYASRNYKGKTLYKYYQYVVQSQNAYAQS